jgi:alkanesulfonate monooxygenase SsuD/methylene tetrahydromethanopterin reductase-like flavin-dependent oxidoreductase (luciferase family)
MITSEEEAMKVGVILPLGEDEKRGRPPSYEETRDRALQAEGAGFDSIWVYDHLLHRFSGKPTLGFWEAWTILSALAESTKRPELGTQVLCTAFRNPAVLAKMADTLDEVCGGRLVLGLGAGWHQPEFDAFGIPFDHRVTRFEEALRIIATLLRQGQVDFEGNYHKAANCELRPRGPRAEGPPIVVAAFGPRMLRLTAQYADSWNTDWLGSPTFFAERRAALEVACAEVGRDPATLGITGGVTVAYPALGDLPAWMNSPDQFLTGSAREVATGLQMYEELGVSHVMCAYYPNSPAALALLGEALSVYRAGVKYPAKSRGDMASEE